MSPKKTENRIITGFAIDWTGNPYHVALLKGTCKAAEKHAASQIIYIGGNLDSPNRSENIRTIVYDYIDPQLIDGLIINTSSIGHFCSLEKLKQFCWQFSSLPVVSLVTCIPGSSAARPCGKKSSTRYSRTTVWDSG